MICISLAQESRRLVLADMLNAARAGDLMEIRLDYFEKAPNVGELLVNKPKPVIMTCRRTCDGGFWEGSEEQRLALLRQCIMSKADFVEIELDVADQIPPFSQALRVISYTTRPESPVDLAEVYAEALTKKPDVIKITALARTLEESWPLIQILAQATVPTVVVGLGKSGAMFNVLGRKMGAPWTYAALERGMESYPGEPTVSDLMNVYHYPAINCGTRLIAVAGLGERERATVAALNAGFAHLGLSVRCLPSVVGDMRLFLKVLKTLQLSGAVIGSEHRRALVGITKTLSATASRLKSTDLIGQRDNHWHGHDTQVSTTVSALEATLKERNRGQGLAAQMVLIVGTDEMALALGRELKQRGCGLILASHDRNACQVAAQELGCRVIQFEALYTTMHDVLIVCEEAKDRGAVHGRRWLSTPATSVRE